MSEDAESGKSRLKHSTQAPPGASIVSHMMWLTISAVGGISAVGAAMHTEFIATLAICCITGVSLLLGFGTLAYAYFRPLANVPAEKVSQAMISVEEKRGGVRRDAASLHASVNPPPAHQTKDS